MPAVHIHNLTVNEVPFESEGYIGEISRVELPYDQNTVALEFTALDYYSNGRNEYQYQLLGYDNQWVQ